MDFWNPPPGECAVGLDGRDGKEPGEMRKDTGEMAKTQAKDGEEIQASMLRLPRLVAASCRFRVGWRGTMASGEHGPG